jgi:predicted DsbA family dithiol-disulfide isomerase
MPENSITVEIYSDIACPWCYIGKRRFSRALSAFQKADRVDVVFRPYQLDPSAPETPQPLKDRLERKFGPQVDAVVKRTTSAAQEEGLELRFDDALAVNTLAAHRLLHFAEQEAGSEVQQALAEKLFESHFTNGQNIADLDLLADLAAGEGLEFERVREYLASDERLDEVRDAISRARQLGIRAVPTFVFNGREALQGAQPTSTFLNVLEKLAEETLSAASSG